MSRAGTHKSLPRLHCSFAQDLRLISLLRWSLAGLIVTSLGAAGWLWQDSRRLESQAGQHEEAAQRVEALTRKFVDQAKRAGIDLTEDRKTRLSQEVAFANRLLEQQAFSWTRFLGDLEEAVPPHVSIRSVALNFKDSVITLNGEALTLKDVTELVNGLENHSAFRNVVLSQHRVKERTAGQSMSDLLGEQGTVEFLLTVVYRSTSS